MEPIKTGADVGSLASTLMAIMNVFNPLMEGVVLLLSASWLIYRFVNRKSLHKKDD